MKNFLLIALLIGVPVGSYWLFRDDKSAAYAGGGDVAAAVASGQPVLLNFYADWCGPCKMVAPEVKALAHDLAGQARVVRIDVDERSDLAQQYGIRSIPAFVALSNGKESRRMTGAISRAQMRGMLGL